MAIKKNPCGTFTVDFRDQTGKRLRKTFDTMKAARQYDRESKGDISRDEFLAPSSITVEQISREWLQGKVATNGYRPAVLGNWQNHINRYIVPVLGPYKIQQVRIGHVEGATAQWTKTCSAKMANTVLTTTAAIFAHAQHREIVKQNVAELAHRVKINRDEEQHDKILPGDVYTEAELKQLINATVPGSRTRCLVMVAGLCGLRIGEILGCLWENIDFKANQLHVRTSLIDVRGEECGRKIASVKSKSSRRTLPLPQELAHELKRWKLQCPQSAEGLVFPAADGGLPHRRLALIDLDRVITAAGIRRLTLHRLRHGFASLLLSKGVPITTVSKLMGHRDATITLKVYAHFIKDNKDHVQELASSILN
jgi:integrase